MAEVTIYSKDYCPFCKKAKSLFDILGQEYQEIDVMSDDALVEEMVEKSDGRTSVPQIFIDGKHVGGFDDVYALHQKGELKTLLG